MMEYQVIRSARRTLCVEVQPNATVTVRAPITASNAEIQQFIMQHRKWIENRQQKQKAKKYNIAMIPDSELPALYQAAKAYIPRRTAELSAQMQLYPTGIKINRAKTRFGSCTAQNSLNFSCRVMIYPKEIVDYVIVHELAHIRHHNHSKAFYRFIEQYLPDYRERIRFLREE